MNAMVLKRMELKAKDRKGFTLVEVIVVLVIIAILMAIAVPALTGYIGKAQGKADQIEAKTVVTAIQAIETESKGTYGIQVETPGEGFIPFGPKKSATEGMKLADLATAVTTLNGQTITSSGATKNDIVAVTFTSEGRLATLKYKTTSGMTVDYTAATNTYAVS